MERTFLPRDAFAWLSAENQAKLSAFKTYAVKHALLYDVDTQLMQAIAEPTGFSHVLVYGPSGVGKSTMLEQLHRHTTPPLASSTFTQDHATLWRFPPTGPSQPPHPLLMVEA